MIQNLYIYMPKTLTQKGTRVIKTLAEKQYLDISDLSDEPKDDRFIYNTKHIPVVALLAMDPRMNVNITKRDAQIAFKLLDEIPLKTSLRSHLKYSVIQKLTAALDDPTPWKNMFYMEGLELNQAVLMKANEQLDLFNLKRVVRGLPLIKDATYFNNDD